MTSLVIQQTPSGLFSAGSERGAKGTRVGPPACWERPSGQDWGGRNTLKWLWGTGEGASGAGAQGALCLPGVREPPFEGVQEGTQSPAVGGVMGEV